MVWIDRAAPRAWLRKKTSSVVNARKPHEQGLMMLFHLQYVHRHATLDGAAIISPIPIRVALLVRTTVRIIIG